MATVTTASIITLVRGLIKDLVNSTGKNVYSYGTDNAFKLSKNRVSASSIIVYQNGVDITSDNWTYNADTNKVTLTMAMSGYILSLNDTIMITFDYYEKYSDSEITSYIKSSLMQFAIRNYKKLFYMNDSSEVVTENGINPDRKEGYIIASITAIDIDPQNVKIKTRDFDISAVEDKSKSELIQDVFAKFNKAYISLGFLEIED